MEDSEIPVLTKDGTDVAFKYKLTYGHVVCQTAITHEAVDVLSGFLGTGSIEYSGELDVARLPREKSSGYLSLETGLESHLIVAEVGQHSVVFAPHHLFLNSTRWLNWNSSVHGLMGYVTQDNEDEHFMIVFRDGQYLMLACAEADSFRALKRDPVEVYANGKLIFSDPGDNPCVTEEIRSLFNSEARIREKQGTVEIVPLCPDRTIEHVTHYVLRRAPQGSVSKVTSGWYSIWRWFIGANTAVGFKKSIRGQKPGK